MRKGTKRKLRSCGLCKPHKTGGDGASGRWKPKDKMLLREFEKEWK